MISSGETTSSGGLVFDALARDKRAPLRVAMLETPAGFELNSDRVLDRVAQYVAQRLQNSDPRITRVAARRRDGAGGTDDPCHADVIFGADLIYLGAGSPTYATRHLSNSWLWEAALARNALGAGIAMASAAAVAAGAYALPVYEIYKAGADPHWTPGLDVFGPMGLRLAIVPHWNNTDGGEELDTSRCFMGVARFNPMRAMLPADVVVVGVDERTGLVIDPETGDAHVLGLGAITVLAGERETRIAAGDTFHASALGPFEPLRGDRAPAAMREAAQRAAAAAERQDVPDDIARLVTARGEARAARDWAKSDALRREIEALGWRVEDTPAGPRAVPR